MADVFTTPTLTPAQKAAAQIESQINAMLGNLTGSFESIFEMVWSNSNASASDIFVALGPNGAQLFNVANIIQTAVNQIAPNTLQQAAPLPYTINQDGSVTINSGS